MQPPIDARIAFVETKGSAAPLAVTRKVVRRRGRTALHNRQVPKGSPSRYPDDEHEEDSEGTVCH